MIDGHDGAGKTTLARLVAHRTGGHYLRPFSGPLVERFFRYREQGDFDSLHAMTHETVPGLVRQYADAQTLVFDRHWLTMLSVLPPYGGVRMQPPNGAGRSAGASALAAI